MTYLEVLFDAGEMKCFAVSKYDIEPSLEPIAGAEWICLNPLKGTRRISNVSTFRNILIELDKGSIDSQLEYIRTIGLPHSTLTYSGGKSIHCVISLEKPASDAAEYRRWVEMVYNAYGLKKLDTSCRDPAKLTRIAGALRKDNGVLQTSLYVGSRIPNETLFAWLLSRLGMKTYRYLLLPKTKKVFTVPATNKYVSKTTEALIKEGVCSESSRHASFTKAAAQLAYNGFNYDEIIELLMEPFESLIAERSITELEGIARWAVTNIKADT